MTSYGDYVANIPEVGTIAIIKDYTYVLIHDKPGYPNNGKVRRIPCDGLIQALALIYDDMLKKGVHDYLPEGYRALTLPTEVT